MVGVGVDGDDLQFYIGRRSDPFAHGPHNGQHLPGTFRWNAFTNFQKVDCTGSLATFDVEPQHDSQHEPIQVHGTGESAPK
jgi:hypothetical protein